MTLSVENTNGAPSLNYQRDCLTYTDVFESSLTNYVPRS